VRDLLAKVANDWPLITKTRMNQKPKFSDLILKKDGIAYDCRQKMEEIAIYFHHKSMELHVDDAFLDEHKI
jgi:hypothetical protein